MIPLLHYLRVGSRDSGAAKNTIIGEVGAVRRNQLRNAALRQDETRLLRNCQVRSISSRSAASRMAGENGA